MCGDGEDWWDLMEAASYILRTYHCQKNLKVAPLPNSGGSTSPDSPDPCSTSPDPFSYPFHPNLANLGEKMSSSWSHPVSGRDADPPPLPPFLLYYPSKYRCAGHTHTHSIHKTPFSTAAVTDPPLANILALLL